jgi:uncharacterized membrane protein YfcA
MGIYLVVAYLVAGSVKGITGMGLPTIAMGIMTLVIDPRSAIALNLIPMLMSNMWQLYRAGDLRGALRRYLPLALVLAVTVWTTVMLTAGAPDRLLFATLGGAILLFVAVNTSRWRPRIPDRLDRAGQVTAGVLAGVMGGLTSVWAPPIVIYLAARQTPKDEFVRASGLLLLLGTVPLSLGYLQQGFLTAQAAAISTALLIPTLIGFTLGEKLRGYLSEAAFRRALLFAFFVMGVNLLRKAIW